MTSASAASSGNRSVSSCPRRVHYDEDANELYEAKGTANREAIRHAIGQLFDYQRHIPKDGVRLALLLPHRPSDDLLDLIAGLGMSCVYEEPTGLYQRIAPMRDDGVPYGLSADER